MGESKHVKYCSAEARLLPVYLQGGKWGGDPTKQENTLVGLNSMYL